MDLVRKMCLLQNIKVVKKLETGPSAPEDNEGIFVCIFNFEHFF